MLLLAVALLALTRAEILENQADLLGVSCEQTTERVYNDSIPFSQIIGYVGRVQEDQLPRLQEISDDYSLNDTVGRTGIEEYMEADLHGRKGSRTMYVDNVGHIMEMKSERTTDTEFLMGEKTGLSIRNMSNPEACGQPAFVGGLYYEPNAHRPNEANGWGGFYADSSLLSLIACRLYQAGMTLDQCKSYWTTVLSAM